MATQTASEAPSKKSNTAILFMAWLAVGLPLLWGVAQTIKKTLTLF